MIYFCFMCVSACLYARIPCVCSSFGGQKKVLDPQELELQTAVSHCVDLGTEPRSFARAASAEPCLQPLTSALF